MVGIKGCIAKSISRRSIIDVPATVIALEYDPKRTAHLALLEYQDGTKTYILAPTSVVVGDVLISSNTKVDFNSW